MNRRTFIRRTFGTLAAAALVPALPVLPEPALLDPWQLAALDNLDVEAFIRARLGERLRELHAQLDRELLHGSGQGKPRGFLSFKG